MREGKVASIWIQILATFPSRIYRREVKSTLSQKPFGRPWVRLATCIVCFAWFRSDHVQRVHRVQRVLVCTASLHQFAHTPCFRIRTHGQFMVFVRACFLPLGDKCAREKARSHRSSVNEAFLGLAFLIDEAPEDEGGRGCGAVAARRARVCATP